MMDEKEIATGQAPCPEEILSALLRDRGLTFSAAESCTGGLIAKRMTDLSGASRVFRGGVVSYVNAVKSGVLGVSEELLEKYGAVSEPVAVAMAEGCRNICGSDLAVSVTGVAGPDRDDRGNSVGTVYVGLACPDGAVCRLVDCGAHRSREEIRALAADAAFRLALCYLRGEAL